MPDVKQVGGVHYQVQEGGIEHWDYCSIVNVPYLESAASKYLTRWRDKGGIEDLRKAQSYIQKRIVLYRSGSSSATGAKKYNTLFRHFIKDNGIPPDEEALIDVTMHWTSPIDLELVVKKIDDLINCVEPTRGYVDQDR